MALYPNPGNGVIRIIDYKSVIYSGKAMKVSVYNSAGICLINNHISDASGALVDISAYPAGIYIIVIYRDDGIKTFRYSLMK